ncbi:pilus assembly protein CpaB [Desulfofundulus australicus DSM 11792]|uniref:Pilus assembly protein CpaB n=1 Tax=Desulfofundulus australicus DSM 11792 TaxID=1121425 RepID=A0A1M4XVG1_9FIRM|nr:pilus assembly protein CpaB [Desulfofundulus australicus DSM 11792]
MRFRFRNPPLTSIRRHLPLLAAVAIGLAVALFSARYLLLYVNTHRETVRVPVPARDIPPYTVISSQDVTWRDIVAGGEEPGAVRDPAEAVGKLSLTTLYRGEQIRKERLADPGLVAGRQVVSLNVDVARCVGGSLRAGDLVDVWWVNDPNPATGWTLAASDAVVLDIRDSAGKSVLASNNIVQQALGGAAPSSSNPPAVVVLAVKTGDVPKVVGGASPKSQNVVLTKKFSIGGAGSAVSEGQATASGENRQAEFRGNPAPGSGHNP